jgi:hypothetical protein
VQNLSNAIKICTSDFPQIHLDYKRITNVAKVVSPTHGFPKDSEFRIGSHSFQIPEISVVVQQIPY